MVSVSDFEKAVRDDLSQLQRELEGLEAQEEQLRQKRASIAARVAERATALKVARELSGVKATAPTQPLPLFGDIPLGTIAQMSAAYMQGHGGAADITDLVTFLRQRGKLPASGSAHGHYGTVFGTLRKSPLFRKAKGKGRFELSPTVGASDTM